MVDAGMEDKAEGKLYDIARYQGDGKCEHAAESDVDEACGKFLCITGGQHQVVLAHGFGLHVAEDEGAHGAEE